MKKIKEDLIIVVYSTQTCPYCDLAVKLLLDEGIPDGLIQKYYVDESSEVRQQMLDLSSGARTVPQIFIDGIHVGGYSDLAASKASGKLDSLLFD